MCCTYLFWKEYQDEGFLCILELVLGLFFFFKDFEDNVRETRLGISFQELPPVFVLSLCTLNDLSSRMCSWGRKCEVYGGLVFSSGLVFLQ